jgi:hypothetical protein
MFKKEWDDLKDLRGGDAAKINCVKESVSKLFLGDQVIKISKRRKTR